VLERIRIRDFAVARDVEVQPGPGLTVFTGETGAGKSIIVDALAFVFGARRGREVIASGADRATVEAVVRDGQRVRTIERTMTLAGRSTARIDGQPATLDGLREAGARLVDIHGQSEQLAILRPAVQVALLDRFAGLGDLAEETGRLVRELRDTRRRLRSVVSDARERQRLIDQLTFELDEIESAALQPGEDEALRAEAQRLASVGRLIEDVAAAAEALDSPALATLSQALDDIAARDPAAVEIADAAAILETALGDAARLLRRYRDGLEDDPGRLAAIQERLDRIARLRRKYGETLDDVLRYAAEARERLEALRASEESAEALQAAEERLIERASAAAARLGAERRAAAGRLVAAIAAELAHLGMGRATLAVAFSCDDSADGLPVPFPDYEVFDGREAAPGSTPEPIPRAFTEAGVDRVEFLASFNPGEAPRPLATVASGGETSRFLLALTTVLGSTAEPRIVVFDEVDEGVGGRAGTLVGEALARLARRHQVLCITHLPQVAAYGDHHVVVSKQTDGRRTWSELRLVDGEARIDELAAMLGVVSDTTRDAARQLLLAARRAVPA
jgi:DNA repair protein RecN (Recombination protein N)